MIKASDVKELRERTGAGMLDCKKALEATSGDMEKAIDWLREKGISKAAKKESRIAAEGLTDGASEDNVAVITEINCETDFVAQNEDFKKLVEEIRLTLLHNDVSTMEEANKLTIEGSSDTLEDAIVNFTAKIGEKIDFRRFERVVKTDGQTFGIYSHMGGKITALVVIDGITNKDVARDVAMHVAAMNPVAIRRDDVPSDLVERESHVIKEQVMLEGKPADIAEKMVTGRLNKFYKEICLEEQPFIKDSNTNVLNYVKSNGGTIVSMIRFAVGDGIEKKTENFADEVMSQVQGA
ncbi:MAG TPA: elongation factor Ts [Candidatus Faecimonas gallistercoris]|nr:elongation factor Ts [Candidatus Faecimonas gallistercoris]